jgi:hypothetical protein
MGIMEKLRYDFRYFHGSVIVLVLRASRDDLKKRHGSSETDAYMCGQPRVGDAISTVVVVDPYQTIL